jgi:flagellar biosynthetic protein FliR
MMAATLSRPWAIGLLQDEPALLLLCQKLGLVLLRTGGLFSFFPLGAELVPARVRATLAVVLALVLLPTVPEPPPGPFVLKLCAEAAVGLLAALLCRLPFLAVEAGLQLASVSAGLGIASLLDPATDEEVHALTEIVSYAALIVFFAVGGHHQLLVALSESFHRVPPGAAALDGGLFLAVLRLSAEVLAVAVQVAAPVMLVALLLNLALALVSRAAPTVNIFSVSLVAVLLLGLVTLSRTLPALQEAITSACQRAIAHYFLLYPR